MADDLVVVFGAKGGVADALASRIGNSDAGLQCRAVFEGADTGLNLGGTGAGGDEGGGFMGMGGGGGGNNAAVVPSAMAGASALVVAPDSPDATEGREVEPSFYSSVANAIKQSNGLRSVFCVVPGDEATEGGSDEGEGGGGGLLGGLQLGPGSWASVKAAAASKGVKCYTLKHGRIFGGVPGAEPLPFQGGPMKEPVLDEHYVARAVMLSRSDALLNLNNANPLGKNMQVRTSRAALSETIYRVLLANKSGDASKIASAFSVLSIEGGFPGDDEWQQQFTSIDDARGIELLNVNFGKVLDRRGLVSWLENQWGPAALQTMSTYIRRTGARPVVVRATDTGAAVRWENMNSNFEMDFVGQLQIEISDSDLRLVRADASGRPLGTSLPGEDELLQRLLEGIETTVYAKNYATRAGVLTGGAPAPVAAESAPAMAAPSQPAGAEKAPWANSPDYAPSATAPSPTEGEGFAAKKAPRRKKRSGL